RLSVRQRRQFHYGDGITSNANQLEAYSDEIFDLDSLEAGTSLRGEAALLASVSAPTNDQMRSVVATIQAEQDAVIRAPATGPLVVQGGPGTGKTVVALHRAAYLLYEQRANLSDTGVLIVGPTTEFLRYIRDVLPSLGEAGVISVTAAKLFPGVLLGLTDTPAVAAIKGRASMAKMLARAVTDRQRQPKDPLTVWYGSRRVVLTSTEMARLFKQAQGHRTHNEGAAALRELVIEALAAQVYDPAFPNTDDAVATFSDSRDVKHFLLRHWPNLSPEQALNDLLGGRALLRSAAGGLGVARAEVDSLHRKRTPEAELDGIRWSEADIPLLDELLHLLSGPDVNLFDPRDLERDEADEFEMAEQTPPAGSPSATAGDDDEIDLDAAERELETYEVAFLEDLDEDELSTFLGSYDDPDETLPPYREEDDEDDEDE
ncbi:MAG: AAA family ATPase, partial [Actinomycetota bacterium]|nr:AAA family ATPase [Actinomycetota bacterium]